MVSGKDNTPASFKALKKYENIGAAWTLYEAEVPAGTKYAAIRCFSKGKMMMFIDDVTYIPAGELKLKVKGYNVWRDGKKLNETPVNSTEYLAATSDENEHDYLVTVVYDKGESGRSNIWRNAWSGIDDAVASEGWTVSGEEGALVIEGNSSKELKVYDMAGRIVATVAPAAMPARLALQSGVYLVSDGVTTVKAAMK